MEHDHKKEDKELEHGGHLPRGDEEETDVLGDTHFPSNCFGLLVKILPL